MATCGGSRVSMSKANFEGGVFFASYSVISKPWLELKKRCARSGCTCTPTIRLRAVRTNALGCARRGTKSSRLTLSRKPLQPPHEADRGKAFLVGGGDSWSGRVRRRNEGSWRTGQFKLHLDCGSLQLRHWIPLLLEMDRRARAGAG